MRKRISPANRKFLLKWLPFNFCDRFCERCEEFRDNCKIYQDDLCFKAQCQLEGKDPYDTKVVFEHVGQMMRDTIKMLQEMMKKEGIEITKEDEERYTRKQKIEDVKAKNHPLYKKCWSFTKDLSKFLENFRSFFEQRPWIIASLQNELGELCFYCHPVFVKTVRGLHSQITEKEERESFPRPDSMVSGALGYYSLLACQKNLESILNLMKDVEKSLIPQINELLKKADEIEPTLKKTFPKVEGFRNKIIFHG